MLARLLIALCVGVAARTSRWSQAVKTGDVQTVRAMVKAKADVNSAEPDGTTALHWAVQNDNVEMVDLLIRSGAKVAGGESVWRDAAALACTAGNAAIVERLLAAGADPNWHARRRRDGADDRGAHRQR